MKITLPECQHLVCLYREELEGYLTCHTHTCDVLYVFDRSLRSLLDGEMEHSAGLRQETDLLKRKLAELEERHTAKVQALAR